MDGILVASGPLWGPAWHPLPVFRAFGLTTAMGDETYRGIAAPMHLVELIDLLDQIITMELHVAFWSAWPPLVEEDKQQGAPGAAGLSGDTVVDPERPQRPDQNRTTDGKIVEPGKFYSVPAGRTWRYLTLPAESTVHLERLYTKATALIDLIGIPSVLRGQAGGQAGYAIAQLMIAARSLYGPVVENFCAQVATQIQYLWWQVWKRFPEGVPVYYQGDAARGKKKGWRTLRPQDVAPDGRGASQGTPFLACAVEADPLLPVDEAQLEMRGIQAQQAGAVDMLTMRERYFKDPAPERTEARVLADKINTHPLVQESMALRGAVRQGALTPEMALSWMEAQFKVTTAMAFDQLLAIGAFTEEEAARMLLQLEQAKAMGQQQGLPGMAGPMNAPGVPAPPGMPGAPPAGVPPPGGSPTPMGVPGGVPGMEAVPAGPGRAAAPRGAPGWPCPCRAGARFPARPRRRPGCPPWPACPRWPRCPAPRPPWGRCRGRPGAGPSCPPARRSSRAWAAGAPWPPARGWRPPTGRRPGRRARPSRPWPASAPRGPACPSSRRCPGRRRRGR